MWLYSVYYVYVGRLLYFMVNLVDYWVINNCHGSTSSSQRVRHLDYPSQRRLLYTASQLKSFRKSEPKQLLSANVWGKLGELGIRKPFRSKRKLRKITSQNTELGLPVVSTGIPPDDDESIPTLNLDISDSICCNCRTDAVVPSLLICNVRSLMAKVDELECFVNLNNVDAVCVTETWLSTEIPDSCVAIQDFIIFRKDRATPCGGVGAYVNCAIPCKRLAHLELTDGITEVLWIQLRPTRLPREVSSVLLGVVYHPPKATNEDNNKLIDHVQQVTDSYLVKHPDSLICVTGDFNPNSTNISPNSFKRTCGLSQIVKVLTCT